MATSSLVPFVPAIWPPESAPGASSVDVVATTALMLVSGSTISKIAVQVELYTFWPMLICPTDGPGCSAIHSFWSFGSVAANVAVELEFRKPKIKTASELAFRSQRTGKLCFFYILGGREG